jgi:hypothetical protein
MRYIVCVKHCGKIASCLAGGAVLSVALQAAEPPTPNHLLSGNPYVAIVSRNVFNLSPPPPPPDPAKEAEKDLPKIVPSGIMSEFGHLKALYKVAAAPPKPGQPPGKDAFYILSEGQGQDDVEVLKIDALNSLVTFKNHGFVQELPLVNAPASGTPAPAVMNNAMPAVRPAGGGINPSGSGGGFITFGAGANARSGNPASGGNNNAGAANNGVNLNSGGNLQSRIYQPEAGTMTPEQAIIAIEAQRAIYQQQGNPIARILPPTPLTDFNPPPPHPPSPE